MKFGWWWRVCAVSRSRAKLQYPLNMTRILVPRRLIQVVPFPARWALSQNIAAFVKAWQALLWGGSVLAVAWGVCFIVGTWPEWVNWTAVLVAFVAGYHVWRTDHVRLIPQFEVKQFVEQSTPVLFGGRPIGTAIYFQLVPKCLTDANVE